MSKHRFERSYLVRRLEVFEVDLPADLNIGEWMEADWIAVDETVCDGQLVSEEYDVIDNDELDLRYEGPVSS